MDRPLVSLIIMSYNYGKYIAQTIQSILDQTYTNWELIIADDNSKDNSLDVIRSFSDPRITLLTSETNQGASLAYNRAYAYCQGKYAGSVDADDYFAREKLEKQVAYMETHPQVDLIGTYINQVDEEGCEVSGMSAYWVNQPRDLNQLENWVISNYICHSTILLRKVKHDRVGGLNPELRLTPDFDLWLRCITRGFHFHILPEKLTYYRVHAKNVSNTYNNLGQFLEFVYLFCRHLAPYLIKLDRPELLDRGLDCIIEQFFSNAPKQLKLRLMEKFNNFPLYPKETHEFITTFEGLLEPGWKEIINSAPKPSAESNNSWNGTGEHLNAKKQAKLVIIDDYFPNVITSFRVHEFNFYLQRLNCEIYSTNPNFEQVWEEYKAFYPEYQERIKPFRYDQSLDCSLLYIVFMWNAHALLPVIEREKIPFIVTLYPGASFRLNDSAFDLRLFKVARSPYLKKMIVTQKIVYDYVIENGFCSPKKIEFIYGAVFPTDYYGQQQHLKRRYLQDKANFDICFVAMKYMPYGKDKGYDTFVEVAKKLTLCSPDFRFHVVGGFDKDEIELGNAAQYFTFYGTQPTQFFSKFYAEMDLILSPNIPFVLEPGAFDGFPTGSCTEAALCEVAVFCTDELKENRHFIPDQEICIISTDPEQITHKIMEYFYDLDRLYAMAKAGQIRFQEVYSTDSQLRPRLQLLSKYL